MSKKQKNDKKNKTITIAILVLLLVIICGVTYAYFSSISTTEKQEITTGDIEIIYETGQDIEANFVIPTEEDEAYLHKFTIRNVGTLSAKCNISFDKIVLTKNSTNITSNNLVWKLYESSETYQITGDAVATGAFGSDSSFVAGNTSLKILDNKVLGIDGAQSYVLKVWLNETKTVQNEDQNMNFSAIVAVDAL